jgi:DNA-binding transcriptional LysR family regulator
MNNRDALLFVRVAESLSFKEGAAQVGISRSAASKRIALLEKELGTTLINRTSRSLSLTSAGELVLGQCRVICAAVSSIQQGIHGQGTHAVGALQVAVPTPVGAALLPSLITDFVATHPTLSVSIHLVDGHVDFVGGGFDVALVVAQRLSDSGLTAKKLATCKQVLVASPGYLRRYGTPTAVADLVTHRCLGIGYARKKSAVWRFANGKTEIEVEVPIAMSANSFLVLNLAACLDMGLLYAPDLYVSSDVGRGRLKPVLPDYTRSIEWGLYGVYSSRKAPAKVRAFLDFVRSRIGDIERRDRWMPLFRQSNEH